MVEYKRGLKAGFFAALIGYAISLIAFVVLGSFDRYMAHSEVTVPDYLASAFIITVFVGCLFGMAFAAVYRFIPTKKSISKAIIFNSLFALIDITVFSLSERTREDALVFFSTAANYFVFLVVFGIFIDGLYFGWLYDFFGRQKVEKPVKKTKKPSRKKK